MAEIELNEILEYVNYATQVILKMPTILLSYVPRSATYVSNILLHSIVGDQAFSSSFLYLAVTIEKRF